MELCINFWGYFQLFLTSCLLSLGGEESRVHQLEITPRQGHCGDDDNKQWKFREEGVRGGDNRLQGLIIKPFDNKDSTTPNRDYTLGVGFRGMH